MKRWLTWFAMAAVAVATLAFDRDLADISNLPRLFCWALALGGVYWLWGWARRPQGYKPLPIERKPLRGNSIFSILFLLWQFVSVLWAVNRAEALFAASRWLLAALTVAVVCRCVARRPARAVVWLSRVSAVVAVVALVPAVVQALSLPDFSWNNRYAVASLFTHKGTFAMLLVLLAVFPAMRLTLRLRRGRWVYVVLLIVLGLAEAFLLSRAVVLSVVAGVAVAGITKKYKLKTQKGGSRLWVVAVLLGCALVGGAAWVAQGPVEPVGEQEGVRSSVSLCERRGLWRMTLRMVGERPVTGCGAGNWKVCHPKASVGEVFSMDVLDFHFMRPHNEYLNIFAETGVVGLMLFMLVAAGFLKLLIGSNSGHSSYRGCELVGLAALVAVAVFAFFDFPFDRAELLLWVSVVAGGVAGILTHSSVSKADSSPNLGELWLPRLLLVGAVVLYGFLWHGERCYHPMMGGVRTMQWGQVERLAHRAQVPLLGSSCLAPDGMPYAYYEAMAREYRHRPALATFRKALHDSPYDKQVMNDVARLLYTEQHQTDSAIALLREAIRISPAYSRSYFNLAQIYLHEGRPAEAREVLEQFDLDGKRARLNRNVWHYLQVGDAEYYLNSLIPAEEQMRDRLLADAEAREDGAEDFIGDHLAGDGAEVVEGIAQVDGHEVGR